MKRTEFRQKHLKVQRCRPQVIERFLYSISKTEGTVPTASEAARKSTSIIAAAQTGLSQEERIPCIPEWCLTQQASANVNEALAERRMARRQFANARMTATSRTLRAVRRGVRCTIDAGIAKWEA